jgi:hypothetical protein
MKEVDFFIGKMKRTDRRAVEKVRHDFAVWSQK